MVCLVPPDQGPSFGIAGLVRTSRTRVLFAEAWGQTRRALSIVVHNCCIFELRRVAREDICVLNVDEG